MNVTLIRYTQDADELAGLAAAKCTHSDTPMLSLKHAITAGHESVIEHASFTFEIVGVSRVLLAQLTRHRIASFSVESQRYCRIEIKDAYTQFVTPPKMEKLPLAGATIADDYRCFCRSAVVKYMSYIASGLPEEDARFVLPQGIKTDLIMTMNARELRHFFALRCCNRAQWEIRQMADEMLRQCKKVAPVLFNEAGPGCLTGPCPEGRKCCGHARDIGEWDA